MRYIKVYDQNFSDNRLRGDIPPYELKIKKDEPRIGDYVICIFNYMNKIWDDYINQSIGVILRKETAYAYVVKYYLTDSIIVQSPSIHRLVEKEGNKKYILMYFDINEIEFFSSNKKDCKTYLEAKKYNL